MAEPIVNPQIPFVGDVPGGLQPGKLIRIQGVTHQNSDRFNINLATGSNNKPRDDTALHLSVRINQGYVARNSYRSGAWEREEGDGNLPIGPAQSFEILLLLDPDHYKVAINGQHFCEFRHRMAPQSVSHILIDGDVAITLISFEGIVLGGESAANAVPLNAQQQFGPPPGGNYGPPPNYGGYGPPPPPGAEPQSEFGGFLDQAQDILAGAIKSGAAEKLLGSIMNSGGNQQPAQAQGYAHQNARYGIYPDLPTQEHSNIPQSNPRNAQDSALSSLISGAGGTITSGPQPSVPGSQNPAAGPQNAFQPPPQNPAEPQHQPGPVEGLLLSFLGGGGGGQNAPPRPSDGTQNQSGGSELISGLLSGLLGGGGGQNQPAAGPGPAPVPQGAGQNQGGGSEMLAGLLQGLLNSDKGAGGQAQPQNQQGGQGSQGGTADVLSGILSSLVSSNQNQQGSAGAAPPPAYNSQGPPPSQSQGGSEALAGILQSLIAGNQQGQGVAQQGAPQSVSTQGQNNTEMITNLLQGLLSKAGDQHNMTRPVQENPGYSAPGGVPAAPQPPPQQYGQYPHPPQQEQKGPVESLLSGLLSGGGGGQQQPQQQPHIPQVGGEGSIGGLGSMGGILGSLAGQLFNKPDPHH